jgi:TolB protein
MFERQRRFSPRWFGAIGIFLGLLIAAIIAAPKVVEVVPLHGSTDVPSTATISITFSQSMDVQSVESRFSTEPQVAGALSWEENTLTFVPEIPWSSGTVVDFQLAAGARSNRFLPILQSHTWSFTVGSARVVYLWPADGIAQLYTRSPFEDQALQITEASGGVLEYGLSVDGTKLAYTETLSSGGSELHLLDLSRGQDQTLYTCEEALCRSPEISPDNTILAFIIRHFVIGEGGKAVPENEQVWGLSLVEEGRIFPIGPEDHQTSNPRWSPEGWLAYYDGTLRAIALIDLRNTIEALPFNYVPSDLGLVGSWSPDGGFLVYPQMIFPPVDDDLENEDTGTSFYSHLYKFEVATGSTIDLSGEFGERLEDAAPVFSPDGRWIAFSRKYLDVDRWTLGRQLWVMRSDGSNARPLTDEPEYNMSSLAWSPDAGQLIYMRKNQIDITLPAEIWLLDVSSGEARALVEGGYLPRWIP